MNTKLLCAISSVILLACGKTGGGGSVPSSDPAVNQAVSIPHAPAQAIAPQLAKQDALQIKGLFIGMDIQSVPSAMMAILAEQGLADFGFTEVIKAGDGTQCVLMYGKSFLRAIEARMHDRYDAARAQGKVDEELRTSCINSDGVLTVKSGADNKVSRIEFNDVKDLFNAKGVAPAEFVKILVKEYHIPELKPDAAQTSWSYISAEGVKVEALTKEILGIPMLRLNMSKAVP